MINIDRILCPLDLSDCSRRGFEHAVAMAQWYDATLTVLHVFERVPVAAYAPGAGSPGAVVMPAERQAIVTELETVVRRQAGGGSSVVLETRDGRTTDEILQAARDLQADLLVLGTHGRSGFERLVLGSVTEKVLRRAACPVLAVPPAGGPGPSPVVCKRILCAVDFSKSSLAALEWATSLAQEADAHLTLVHVMDYGIHEWPEIYERFMDGHVSLEDFRTYCRESSRERLELAVPAQARTYATIETMQVAGKPYREIVRVAAERHCDLIVMGVRGPATFEHALLGSTTQQVVRLAEVPVLVVPAG